MMNLQQVEINFENQIRQQLTWDTFVQQVDGIDQLNKSEQENAKNALQTLRVAFGESFPYRAWKMRHPLSDYLVGITTPWKCRWLIQFAVAFNALKEGERFKGLWKRIKSTNQISQAIEGLSVLEIAYSFFIGGFQIVFEPSVTVAGKRHGRPAVSTKKPDLMLVNEETKEEIYVEVTALGRSEAHQSASHTYERIASPLYNLLWTQGYVPYARIHQALSEKHLKEVETRLRALVEEVKRDNVGRTFIIPNTIEIGIAPEHDQDSIHQWAAAKGIEFGVTGPRIPLTELPRTRKRIYCKKDQLPENRPGIIVIHQYNPLFQTYSTEEIVAEIEREVRKYPQLLCAIISHRYLSPSEASDSLEKKGPHLAQRKKIIDPLWEDTTILFNDLYKGTITNSTLDRLNTSLVKH